jgi:anaphase-promoting complex subunit 8
MGTAQELYTQFPNSTHVVMQSAVAHYNLRNFDDAQALFVDLQSHDEFRIDGMDIFSNILSAPPPPFLSPFLLLSL